MGFSNKTSTLWGIGYYFIILYFGEISEISTHYNNITFLKFRGNIRNLAVSIKVLQPYLKFRIFPRNLTNFNWHAFQQPLKISGKTSQFLVFVHYISGMHVLFRGVVYWDLKKLKKKHFFPQILSLFLASFTTKQAIFLIFLTHFSDFCENLQSKKKNCVVVSKDIRFTYFHPSESRLQQFMYTHQFC